MLRTYRVSYLPRELLAGLRIHVLRYPEYIELENTSKRQKLFQQSN